MAAEGFLADARAVESVDDQTGAVDLTGDYVPAVTTGASPPSTERGPLWYVRWADTPLTTDVDIASWGYTASGVEQVSAWINEEGHYRAESRAGTLFDHLVTLIGSYATATGDLLRFERRDASNVRQATGGVNQDGRLKTSMYAWTAPASFGSNYSSSTTDGFSNSVDDVGVRLISDDIVEIRGCVLVGGSNTSNNDVMFTLPSSAWYPAKSRCLNIGLSAGSAAAALVRANGTVTLQRGGVTAGTTIYMDVRYRL